MKAPKFHIYSGTARLKDPVISHSLLRRSSLDQPACHFCYRSNDIYPLLYARSISLIPKPLHRVRPLAPQGPQLRHRPGKVREASSTTALEDCFPGICRSATHAHARRKMVTVLLPAFQRAFTGLRVGSAVPGEGDTRPLRRGRAQPGPVQPRSRLARAPSRGGGMARAGAGGPPRRAALGLDGGSP